VEAWGSAHVEAGESAHVEARESAHVEARESAHVVAWESAHVEASQYVSVHLYGTDIKVVGGVQIKVPEIRTAEQWCDWYGVPIVKGVVTLFKAVGENFVSSRNFAYKPGTKPIAPDWDGGKEECGGGLHFCPHPVMALTFNSDPKHFVACPVRVKDIVVHYPAMYPTKIKAKRCCAPVWECDRNGKRIESKKEKN
jgi:hypothetical protein